MCGHADEGSLGERYGKKLLIGRRTEDGRGDEVADRS